MPLNGKFDRGAYIHAFDGAGVNTECPGVLYDPVDDVFDECDETPSMAVVLHVPGGKTIETELLVCRACASGKKRCADVRSAMTKADHVSLFDQLPVLKRRITLWCEIKGYALPDWPNMPITFMKPTK